VIGGCGLFLEVFIYIIFPEYAAIATLLLIPQTVAEFLFLAWVLIRGIKER